jgi:hypothetical protein
MVPGIKKIEQIKNKIPVKYFTLSISIIGVIFLYMLSLFQQPIVLTSGQSIEDYEGKEVTLEGIILEYQTTNYGNQFITLQFNSTQITVFSETPIPIHIGDLLQATGKIEKYKDSWELILSNPKATRTVEKWQNRTIQIKDLANHPDDYLQIPINVSGYIDVKYDDLVYICDYSNNYTIPLIPLNNSIPDAGTSIYAHATLTYDPANTRYILTKCNNIKPISKRSEG